MNSDEGQGLQVGGVGGNDYADGDGDLFGGDGFSVDRADNIPDYQADYVMSPSPSPSPPRHLLDCGRIGVGGAEGDAGPHNNAEHRHRHQHEIEHEQCATAPIDPNNSWCNICKDGGTLLCCDRCVRAFHLKCLGLEERDLPGDTWYCELCSRVLRRAQKREAQTQERGVLRKLSKDERHERAIKEQRQREMARNEQQRQREEKDRRKEEFKQERALLRRQQEVERVLREMERRLAEEKARMQREEDRRSEKERKEKLKASGRRFPMEDHLLKDEAPPLM